ncbi:cation/H+ exchanger [Dichomitus squalens LYAD-421 SS1]|uniref:Cation/H+ exchanger n=1 Tax=Dichomitus squalens (strain LYAD-421) TaxID=732165 RepID=R7T1J9_DICSQ|nr:cation/H+ exchanger [Dichomitus squalens LYAD-421 SS1]EJF62314.1 cation/H+ exchanger [Dichomitus squalens LYAD-421 SS1]
MGAFSADVLALVRRAAAPEQAGIIAGDNPADYNSSDPFRLWVIQVVIVIGMTQLLALFLSRIRQPRVIAEVIGGVLLGPSVMGHIPNFTNTIFPTQSLVILNLTANLGLVLFMFLVGMEIDMRVIRRNVKAAAAISIAGLIIPLGLGAALAVPIYHQFTDGTASFGVFVLFIAVAVGITAFPVLCRILTELRLLDTTVGVVTLSAGVGNDVIGWVLLALSVALINSSSGLTALWVLLAGIGFVIFILFPVRWAYHWLAVKTGSLDAGTPSTLMMSVTIVMVLISGFYTDVIGIHEIFGGFLAGLIIPKKNGYAIALVEKLEDILLLLLLPLYFAFTGLRTNLGLLNNGITWGYTILICVIAFFSKFLACGITAKIMGFSVRESGAIGALMSCKGLVELIVLNVGLSAGILDTRTFSMFVLHALVLTFMTTPLTILFYPAKYRVRIREQPKQPLPSASTEDGTGASRSEIKDSLKTRFAIIVDRIEQLPAIMTITQLLQIPFSMLPDAPSSDASSAEMDEKAAMSEGIPTLTPARSSMDRPRISVDVLRLIELTNRASAVLKSQAADALAQRDPILAIFKTFGYLHRIAVSTALAVVGGEDFAENVTQHARAAGSQMVILPWTNALGSESLDNDVPDSPTDAASPSSAASVAPSPFDGLFQARHEGRSSGQTATTVHSHFVRRVFADAPADVALFWDRGAPGSPQLGGGDAQFHAFVPFFGGPDDRAALAFVVQLCLHPSVSATVVRMKKVDGAALEPVDTIEQIKLQNTVHATVFPDTVYGAQTTQTRLASETADDLLWTRLASASSASAGPEAAAVRARMTFVEEASAQPLHRAVELHARSPTRGRQIVVAGRSRRMAVESHEVELQKLAGARGAALGSELPKTLGCVACAFVVAGPGHASLLVVQAAQKW